MKRTVAASIALMLTLIGFTGYASATLWDLESTVLGQSLSVQQTADGITLTIFRPGPTLVEIVDITQPANLGVPANFGNRTLSPFNNVGPFFIGNFSSTVFNVGFDFGDFLNSDTDVMMLQAFSGPNGTGTLLGSISSAPCCDVGAANVFEPHSIFLNVAGINSIVFRGGSASAPNSMYVDNFQANVVFVPEPSSFLLLGSALLGLIHWIRQKNN